MLPPALATNGDYHLFFKKVKFLPYPNSIRSSTPWISATMTAK